MAIFNTKKTPTKSTPVRSIRFAPVKKQLTVRGSSTLSFRAPSPFPFRRPVSRHVKKYVAGRKAPIKVKLGVARRRRARRSLVKKGSAVREGGQVERAPELNPAGERVQEGNQPNQAPVPRPAAEGLLNRMNNLLAVIPAVPITWPVGFLASRSG
ncbi:hypothetical protein FKP32DRAFT_1674658 [Trametes sanguinea]|nr:hypothetical protein FKP32DRAFT_1674658 [Trametes sanguinea]